MSDRDFGVTKDVNNISKDNLDKDTEHSDGHTVENTEHHADDTEMGHVSFSSTASSDDIPTPISPTNPSSSGPARTPSNLLLRRRSSSQSPLEASSRSLRVSMSGEVLPAAPFR